MLALVGVLFYVCEVWLLTSLLEGASSRSLFSHPVMWPSAVVLSRWLMTNPSAVTGKRVLELGAGCGLTGLLAARIQQVHGARRTIQQPNHQHDCERETVILTDFNPTVVNNLLENVALNGLQDACRVAQLDFYQQSGKQKQSWKDMNGQTHESADVVLAADMICQQEDAIAAANAVYDALVPGGKAYCVCADSTHRFGVDRFASDCKLVGLNVEMWSVQELYEGEFLKAGLEKTAGYVEGMTLTFFALQKAAQ